MKILRNEADFRTWYVEDFRKLSESDDIFSDVEAIELLIREGNEVMPLSFPCVAFVLAGDNIYEPRVSYYASWDQVVMWLEGLNNNGRL